MHSRRRWGETKYTSRSVRSAASGPPASSSSEASLAGRMPVRAPQAGVTPVRARAASKKLSFTARCRSRSPSYSSAPSGMAVLACPRAVRPSTVKTVSARASRPSNVRETRALSASSPS